MKSTIKDLATGGGKATILLYAALLAALLLVMKLVEYRFFIRDLSVEVYVGVVATLCTLLGIWVGSKLINSKKADNETAIPEIDREKIQSLRISNREMEVLQLISDGHSNQEIADRLFISVPTVKTHTGKIFEKLSVNRRTQAVQQARELKIIL